MHQDSHRNESYGHTSSELHLQAQGSLQFQPPQRSASYQSYCQAGRASAGAAAAAGTAGGVPLVFGGVASQGQAQQPAPQHLPARGTFGFVGQGSHVHGRQSLSTPTSPVLFGGVDGYDAEHWRPLGEDQQQQQATSCAGSSGAATRGIDTSELVSIFRRLQDATASNSGIGDEGPPTNATTLLPPKRSVPVLIKPMAPAAVATGPPPAGSSAPTAMPSRTLGPTPESAHPAAPSGRAGATTSSTAPPGAGNTLSPKCHSPNPGHRRGGTRELSPTRGKSSPATEEGSGSLGPSDAQDGFPDHPDEVMLPEYGEGMMEQESIDMDTSHISIIPVSRNLTDAFESMSMYGTATVPDHNESAAVRGENRRESQQHREGQDRQSGFAGRAGREREGAAEGREDVEQAASSRSRVSGGAEAAVAKIRASQPQQQPPAVTPAAKPTVAAASAKPTVLTNSDGDDIDKEGAATKIISPTGIEQLDVEGQHEEAQVKVQQRDEQQQRPRQPSREGPKAEPSEVKASSANSDDDAATIPPGQGTFQSGHHPAPPQDAPRRASSSTLMSSSSEQVVVPFDLHPYLRLELPQPVIDRVSFYGIVHDINKEAGCMASHDENASAGAPHHCIIQTQKSTLSEAEPRDGIRSPLVLAVRGPSPEDDDAEEDRQQPQQQQPQCDGAFIDEERWLLSAIASRSPEEVAQDRVTSIPPTFAEAIGEQETGEDTHTSKGKAGSDGPPPKGEPDAAAGHTANPLNVLAANRTQLWKPSRSWWEAKSGKNPWIEPTSHNKRWRYLWPLIHYHKFLAKCIKKLKRNGVDVKASVSPVAAFLREEVCAISDHLCAVSKFNSEEWMVALVHFTGWTAQDDEAEEAVRKLVSRLDLRGMDEPCDIDSPLLRDQIDAQFLRAMAAAREQMASCGKIDKSSGSVDNKTEKTESSLSSSSQEKDGRPPMPPGASRGQSGRDGNKQKRRSRSKKRYSGDSSTLAEWDGSSLGSASQGPPPLTPYDMMQHGMYPPHHYPGDGFHHGGMYNPHTHYLPQVPPPPPFPHPGMHGAVPMDPHYFHHEQGYGMPHSYMGHPHHYVHGQPHSYHHYGHPMMPMDGSHHAVYDNSTIGSLDSSMHDGSLAPEHFPPLQGANAGENASGQASASQAPFTPDQSVDHGHGAGGSGGSNGSSGGLPSPAWAHLDQITANLIATPHQTPSAKRTGRKGRSGSGSVGTHKHSNSSGSGSTKYNPAARPFVFPNQGQSDTERPGQEASGKTSTPPSPATQFAQSQSPNYIPRIAAGGGRKQIAQSVASAVATTASAGNADAASTSTPSETLRSGNSSELLDKPPDVVRTTEETGSNDDVEQGAQKA